MKRYRLHANPRHKAFRVQLRKNLTPAETMLWSLLKNRQLDGRKFRRQQSIGPYIVDFYCPEEQLVIELDGQYHFTETQAKADAIRDAWLQQAGFRVLRFENKVVFEATELLLDTIRECFKK